MTRAELKLYAATKTNLVNSSGAFVDGLVTETNLDTYFRLRNAELHSIFADKFPEEANVASYANLVADTDIYALTGDIEDYYTITGIWIKYASTNTKYTRVKPRSKKRLFKDDTSSNQNSTSGATYYIEPIKDSITGVLTKAIYLDPTPTANVTRGLRVDYVETPDPTTIDDDYIPYIIPNTAHIFIAMAMIADIWEQKGDLTRSDKAMNRCLYERDEFFKNYQPRVADEPVSFTPSRRCALYNK